MIMKYYIIEPFGLVWFGLDCYIGLVSLKVISHNNSEVNFLHCILKMHRIVVEMIVY
jgi:hypothetical protein